MTHAYNPNIGELKKNYRFVSMCLVILHWEDRDGQCVNASKLMSFRYQEPLSQKNKVDGIWTSFMHICTYMHRWKLVSSVNIQKLNNIEWNISGGVLRPVSLHHRKGFKSTERNPESLMGRSLLQDL